MKQKMQKEKKIRKIFSLCYKALHSPHTPIPSTKVYCTVYGMDMETRKHSVVSTLYCVAIASHLEII